MKLVRFGEPGAERPGVWLGGDDARVPAEILDVRAMAFDLRDYDARFFRHGGIERVRALLTERSRKTVRSDTVRLGPPVARPGKILCLGKNYAEHAAEFGSEVPARPVVFAKAPTAVIGPFDPIRLAPASTVVDGEVELAFVVGRAAKRLDAAGAMPAVAGYLVLNDVTDREAQRAGQQWFYGKGFDTFCPLGPFLVTPDEAPDPHGLRLFSRLNGAPLQDGRTSDMVFRLPAIVEFLSAAMTLEPGDVVATGTPSGIGSARRPPVLLRPGDLLETGAEGLGTQANPVVRDA
jgi:2-keto-4-pentenoate hydratase/2-oxohepta-3-ene-1,7-dioic acid hydratase in catechol pathway